MSLETKKIESWGNFGPLETKVNFYIHFLFHSLKVKIHELIYSVHILLPYSGKCQSKRFVFKE